MLMCCINKYFRRPLGGVTDRQPQGVHNNMVTICTEEEANCTSSCCCAASLSALLIAEQRLNPTTTTTGAIRSSFTHSTTTAIFPHTHFTNHESLPSLPHAFNGFATTFPKYGDTHIADRIRDTHYPHLATHTCLDYSGLGLFSNAEASTTVSTTSTSSSATASSSSSSPQPAAAFFEISYKPASPSRETALESAIKKRIMGFLNILGENYTMVCTANRTAAFKLLAESYCFPTHKRLLTVYDHESEALRAIADTAAKRGAKPMSASFSWPSLHIHGAKLKRMVTNTKSKKQTGLFVFPLQSRITGARYPYIWMRLAQENGWHVALDASALGPKETDTLGISIIQPDFIVCSFYKVFGGNPSGFAALFTKKDVAAAMAPPPIRHTIGVVSIVPAVILSPKSDDDEGEITAIPTNQLMIECRGFDHADSIGPLLISSRLRCIVNWLLVALMKLRHPHSEEGGGLSLVRIYGPRVKFDRAPAVAFNVFDWKGEKVEPDLVQKLADRSGVSLSCGFLQNLWFSDKYREQKDAVLERKSRERRAGSKKRESTVAVGISVVSASFGFLANFQDAYRLWVFVAKFLDADFVEKERWRYVSLNQKLVEV